MSAPLRETLAPLEDLAADLRRARSLARYRTAVRLLIDRIYDAADIIDSHETTVADLMALSEDAIARVEQLESEGPTDAANRARTLRADQKAIRARRLAAEKLTKGAIGRRMAREDGRAEPYPPEQVRRWLRRTLDRTDRETSV